MTDENPTTAADEKPATETPTTFTQAEVDRIVADRLKRERETTKTKYADYDAIKEKAGQASTLEERVAEIERIASESERRALVAEVAVEKKLTPNQAKRLVGDTREDLLADADTLLADIGEQKKQGNRAPSEGAVTPTPAGDDREFVRQLFASAD